MTSAEHNLAERIRELRRRHFGPRGKGELAKRLGLSPEEYERYERGVLPPGEVMVRLCEVTGEDLQWLLTGVAARSTVVISGTRTRHQEVLTRLARLLDDKPALAAPVEAFVDLLLRGAEGGAEALRRLPLPSPGELIPILEGEELPLRLPGPGEPDDRGEFPLLPPLAGLSIAGREPAGLAEPASDYDPQAWRRVDVLTLKSNEGATHRYLRSREIAECFPGVFGVRLSDDAMTPMFRAGEAVLVSVGAAPKIGHPALCRFIERTDFRCRIWLGEDEQHVHLGRLADGEMEHVERANLGWSLEVLYRLAAA